MISNSTTVSANNNSVKNTNKNKNSQNPNFKGIGGALMNATGGVMNGIENGGFVASFLIQDTLGMTVPRTREGLYRDRDKKHTKFKDMNFKEAGEVFIREFLSGPLMMFTPFIVFALTKKYMGKSTFTNTGLLKKMGKNFTEVIKNKKTTDTAKGIKENFYRNTIKQMVEHTTPEAAGKPQSSAIIDKIYGHVTKLDELETQVKTAKGRKLSDSFMNMFRKKANKVKSEKDLIKEQIAEHKNGITEGLNSFHTENSSNLGLVNKVKVENETYGAAESIQAMRSYASDILQNGKAADLTEDAAKQFEKKAMGKRIFSTLAASVATIASTSIVPSLYAILNPVPPGALDEGCHNPDHDHKPEPQAAQKQAAKQPDNKKGQVPFKGNILKQMQFDGNQLTPLLMTALAGGGLIVPRVHTAVKRAPQDKDGKKNLIEVPEILVRDIVSTTAVTFGVPVLTKAMVNTYEKSSGFVLSSKQKGQTSTFKKILDTINPLSNAGPYSNKDIESIYGHIDNKAKLMNLAEFVNKEDGNLFKVFKTLKNGQESFAGTAADFGTISKLDNKSANAKIMEVITEHFDDAKVKKLMEPAKPGKLNGMLKRARGLNSLPRFVNTLVLVPAFLGIILPKIVYGITANNRKKMEMAKNAQPQTTVKAQPNNTPAMVQGQGQPQFKKSERSNKTFEQLKHRQ